MNSPLEMRALAWAVPAAFLSLGGTWLAAEAIRTMGGPGPASALLPEASPAIVVSPELVNQGREAFGLSCSHCHGADAHGDEGPDLHHLSLSNARIATTIRKGIKGEMPSFSKKYDDRQVAALVSYLRSLR